MQYYIHACDLSACDLFACVCYHESYYTNALIAFLIFICCFYFILLLFCSRYSPARLSLRKTDMKLPKQILESAMTSFR